MVWNGNVGTGVLGWKHGDRGVGLGSWGPERGDGSIGTGVGMEAFIPMLPSPSFHSHASLLTILSPCSCPHASVIMLPSIRFILCNQGSDGSFPV